MANNINAGTATVTVTGKGNYTGTVTKTFAINKAPLSITTQSQSITYGDALFSSFAGGCLRCAVTAGILSPSLTPQGLLGVLPTRVLDPHQPLHARQSEDGAGLGGGVPDRHLPAQLLHDGVPPHDEPQPRGVHEADGGEIEDELGGAFFKEGGVDALTDGGGGVVVDLPADADG